MYISELMLGSGLTRAIGFIGLRAMNKDTREGYQEAIHELQGINLLLDCCKLADAGTTISIQNIIFKLGAIADRDL